MYINIYVLCLYADILKPSFFKSPGHFTACELFYKVDSIKTSSITDDDEHVMKHFPQQEFL